MLPLLYEREVKPKSFQSRQNISLKLWQKKLCYVCICALTFILLCAVLSITAETIHISR